MKIMTVFGTRPEMIKMWSTLRKLDGPGFDHVMVHTGQNFTPELRDLFFTDLELREPDFNLNIDTTSYGREVADVISKTDELFEKIEPDALLVLGDTFSCLSVMPAAHRGVKIFHMEAGLRAWDRRMPEQRNRLLIDHMSDILLPYNSYHRENLIRENIHPSKIFVTGNPTFEAMRAYQTQVMSSDILSRLSLDADDYFLATAHRSENVDNPETLSAILQSFGDIHERFGKTVLFAAHPRTQQKLTNLGVPKGVQITKPFGFYDFNKLVMNCSCFISDSGTAAEESLFYKVPCVSIRMTTERPETVEAGGHIVAGLETDQIVAAVATALGERPKTRYDFSDDLEPSGIIINILRSNITNFF